MNGYKWCYKRLNVKRRFWDLSCCTNSPLSLSSRLNLANIVKTISFSLHYWYIFTNLYPINSVNLVIYFMIQAVAHCSSKSPRHLNITSPTGLVFTSSAVRKHVLTHYSNFTTALPFK